MNIRQRGGSTDYIDGSQGSQSSSGKASPMWARVKRNKGLVTALLCGTVMMVMVRGGRLTSTPQGGEGNLRALNEGSAATGAVEAHVTDDDACAGQWRDDELAGKCFGLNLAEQSNGKWQDCRAYCCALGDKCVTWQWREDRGCRVGGPVRVGLEQAGTADWCEESAPMEWKGRWRDESQGAQDKDKDAACVFQEEGAPYQCFGLGPERMRKQEGGDVRLSEKECAALCCEDKAVMYQWREDKGCFVGAPGHCEKDNEAYKGGRKCVPGFCGGQEKTTTA